jgi:hypothetical protein
LPQNPFSPFALPLMMAELTAASWETVWHRTTLMMSGACSPAEYTRMMTEKMSAIQMSSAAVMAGEGPEAILHPFHKRATANARRLRK